MNKLIVAFVLAFFLCTLVEVVYQGGTSLGSTVVVTAIDEDDTAVTVKSTQGFSPAGLIEIGQETISYNGTTATTFTNLGRGYGDSDADSHAVGAQVYTPSTSSVNAALGFSVISSGSSLGITDIMMFPIKFATKTAPKVVSWNYDFLKDNDVGQLIRYGMWCLSAGFLFIVAYYIMAALGGLLQNLLTRV